MVNKSPLPETACNRKWLPVGIRWFTVGFEPEWQHTPLGQRRSLNFVGFSLTMLCLLRCRAYLRARSHVGVRTACTDTVGCD